MRNQITFLLLLALGACNRRPSPADAMRAFHAGRPGADSSPVYLRVWADGPPWFSCAEVVAKLKSEADRQVIRDDIGHWRSLIVADWISLRDTVAGPVVEPGWCAASLRSEAERIRTGWRVVRGDSLASGGLRRGWDVLVGAQKVAVPNRTKLVGRDSARALYVFTVAPNTNGVATGADRDTVFYDGLLEKVDGRWRLVRLDDHHLIDAPDHSRSHRRGDGPTIATARLDNRAAPE